MNATLVFDFSVDKKNKTINVQREFAAGVDLVWDAWTNPDLLDQWWAPKPWRTETKSMDFREGGAWLYAMVGPNGERHWARADYQEIVRHKKFSGLDGFCDQNGNINTEFPRSLWTNVFKADDDSTTVNVTITYKSLSDLEKILELGFKEGFTMALGNLDQYLETQFKMRAELNPGVARVCSYLNFDGNTEDAFKFYKSVFKTEFLGKGIQRFGDIKQEAGHPPVADAIRNMVIHVELPITGGHVLMGTDAPKEMGFTLTSGNNMHICLEPASRKEAKRLFDELSAGGNVTMPLEDMFFGAYFGEFTDKYGINWMINCLAKK